jgi:hypothetical protein
MAAWRSPYSRARRPWTASFTFVYLAVSDLTPVLRTLHPWDRVGGLLGVLAAIVTPALAAVVITIIPRLRIVFGLAERVFLLSSNLWFLAVTAMLIVRDA